MIDLTVDILMDLLTPPLVKPHSSLFTLIHANKALSVHKSVMIRLYS